MSPNPAAKKGTNFEENQTEIVLIDGASSIGRMVNKEDGTVVVKNYLNYPTASNVGILKTNY